jgi:hypothetical protein
MRRTGFKRSLPLSAYKENKEALDLLIAKRNLILEERSKRMADKFKTKLFREIEKSFQFFLNMLRAKIRSTNIDSINTGRGEVRDELGIKNYIETFSKYLYEHGSVINMEVDESYFQYIERVQITDVKKVTSPLRKYTFYYVLKTCNDSAQGPVGIPYSYFRQYWNFFGNILVQS